MLVERKVQLLPNTGHQFMRIPLVPDSKDLHSKKDVFTADTFPTGDVPWSVVEAMLAFFDSDKTGWWQSANGASFLWRLSKMVVRDKSDVPQSALGLVVAFETNVGPRTRGNQFRRFSGPRSAPVQAKPEDEGYVPPYYADTVEALYDLPAPVLNWSASSDLHIPIKEKSGSELRVRIEIQWLPKMGDPVDVDLVIDFGNTRTVVLGIEDVATDTGHLNQLCRPIYLERRDQSSETHPSDGEVSRAIIPSWTVTKEPLFSKFYGAAHCVSIQNVQPTATRRWNLLARNEREHVVTDEIQIMPHRFKQLSPVVLGAEAGEELANPLDNGFNWLSSPKRYVWDDRRLGTSGMPYWTMYPNEWHREREAALLSGEFSVFTPEHDQLGDWPDHSIPPTEWDEGLSKPVLGSAPNWPRREALKWAALHIFESAYRTINSVWWREYRQKNLERRLRDVYVVFPPGWTIDEITLYRSLWTYAARIFATSRFDLRDAQKFTPRVLFDLDEAFAPQLAIVFSIVRHLNGRSAEFLRLFGSVRASHSSARVMTLDIGGGTTDVAIIEYTANGSDRDESLNTSLLFRDSLSLAGDELVRRIIEHLLLPRIGERCCTTDLQRDSFAQACVALPDKAESEARRVGVARDVFWPIVLRWLQYFGKPFAEQGASASISPVDCGVTIDAWSDFGDILSKKAILLPGDLYFSELSIDRSEIEQVVREWFRPIGETFSTVFARLDCDLLLLTGKTSELPAVIELARFAFPISSDRLIPAKNFYAGDWLPLSQHGMIPDAKLTTAIGGALYVAMKRMLGSGSGIHPPKALGKQKLWWGIVRPTSDRFREDDILLRPENDECTVNLPVNAHLGRALFSEYVRAEQVYQLCWLGQNLTQPAMLRVTIRRSSGSDADAQDWRGSSAALVAEGLGVVEAFDPSTGSDVTAYVRLALRTLPHGDSHWLDDPRFEVRWPSRVS